MARSFGAVSAGRHIAPPSFAVAAAVMKDAAATCVCAPVHAGELSGDECISRRFDDRREERGENIAGGDEVAGKTTVGTRLHAA